MERTRIEAHWWIFWASRCNEFKTPVSTATDEWTVALWSINIHCQQKLFYPCTDFFYGRNTFQNKIQCLRQTSATHLSCLNGLRSGCNHRTFSLHTCGFCNLGKTTDGGWAKCFASGVAGSDLDWAQHNTLDLSQIVGQSVLHVETPTAKTLPVENRKRRCDTNRDKFRLDRYLSVLILVQTLSEEVGDDSQPKCSR